MISPIHTLVCITNPNDFCSFIEKFAPVLVEQLAPKRYPDKCKQGGVTAIQGGSLQQAIIFFCKESPSLSKHFDDANEYVCKMKELRYESVPFGEDVVLQILLYI